MRSKVLIFDCAPCSWGFPDGVGPQLTFVDGVLDADGDVHRESGPAPLQAISILSTSEAPSPMVRSRASLQCLWTSPLVYPYPPKSWMTWSQTACRHLRREHLGLGGL